MNSLQPMIDLAYDLLHLMAVSAVAAIFAAILLRVWARIASRARYLFLDAYWMIAWLVWRGWVRGRGYNAKHYLEVAIKADQEKKDATK